MQPLLQWMGDEKSAKDEGISFALRTSSLKFSSKHAYAHPSYDPLLISNAMVYVFLYVVRSIMISPVGDS
jgi:hypothetical protein